MFSKEVDMTLRDICLEISKRYEFHFLEIGTDKNHVHFLVQSVQTYSATKILTMIKSLIAREMFMKQAEVKKKLNGGEFWKEGYFVNAVSKFGDQTTITNYVKEQGMEKEFSILHKNKQLRMF